MDIQEMMKQAQVMQKRMQEMQESLGGMEVQGQSGGGLVTVTMNCRGEIKKIDISPDVIDPSEKETLEDLVIAAVNAAKQNADETLGRETQKMMQDFGLPGGAGGAGGLPGGF